MGVNNFKHCDSSTDTSGECRWSQHAVQANRLGLWVRRQSAAIHIHHRHITQPKSWYSFYYPSESGKLSRARHCTKVAAGKAQDLVSQWLSCWTPALAWSKPRFSHAAPGVPLPDHCDLLGEWVWTTCPKLLPDSAVRSGFKPMTTVLQVSCSTTGLSSHPHPICLLVCLSGSWVHCEKNGYADWAAIWDGGSVGQRNYVLGGGWDPHQ